MMNAFLFYYSLNVYICIEYYDTSWSKYLNDPGVSFGNSGLRVNEGSDAVITGKYYHIGLDFWLKKENNFND